MAAVGTVGAFFVVLFLLPMIVIVAFGVSFLGLVLFLGVVVVAFGAILKPALLSLAPRGAVNVHASLLPAYRGAAPVPWSLIHGERMSGVTTMFMDEGMDTGPMLATEAVPITGDTTASDLHDALARIGGRLIVDVLSGELPTPMPQREDGVTYASKLDRTEGRIDWAGSAADLDRRVRALNPWPGVCITW